ncbi:SH3 domain-containing protein [Jiella endophytica]|nr:SH3 domain-containing protein [Jiella endophytica]
MRTGDRHSGAVTGDRGVGRPSEEAIRNRLIDRRKAYDAAEADRRLMNRLRQRLLQRGPGSSRPGRPLPGIGPGTRAIRGLRDRPIIAFCLAASLSAVILVPLALSSYAPLPGEAPLPLAANNVPEARTAVPQDVKARRVDDLAEKAGEKAVADTGAKPSMFEALEREEAPAKSGRAIAAESDRGRETPRQAAAAGVVTPDGELKESAALRKTAPAEASASAATAGENAAAPDTDGAASIDPVAAALALRLPSEPVPMAGNAEPDPVTTGGIPSPAPLGDVAVVTAGDPASGMAAEAGPSAPAEAASQAGGVVAVSPSILIADTATPGTAAPAPNQAEADQPAEGEAPDASRADAGAMAEASAAPTGSKARATASVNMRSEPTNNGKIVAILAKGDAVTVLSCKGWCEIETASGAKGYVYEKFIDRGSEG